MRIIGLKGRNRVLEVLAARRVGRLGEMISSEGAVEFMLLYRGRWKACERNRVRRRIREGVRYLALTDKLPRPRIPLVLKAERRMLNQEWKMLLESIMNHARA